MSPRPSNPLTLEFILLGLLERRPMHGYDLFRELSNLDGVGMLWRIKQSRMYAMLDKLETEGYLHHQEQHDSQYPLRKVFSLTAAGSNALDAWRTSPVARAREMRQDFLARLFFARANGAACAVQLVEAQCAACLNWRADLLDRVAALPLGPSFERAVLSFRLRHVDGLLSWLGSEALECTR